MKIKGEMFRELEAAILRSPVYPRLMEYRESGLSDMRWRWDCVWGCPKEWREDFFRKIYRDLDANDDHVDTALRRITGTK